VHEGFNMPHIPEDEHMTCANDGSVKVEKFVATVFVNSRITNREASLVAAETDQDHKEVRAIPAAAQSHDLRGVDLAGLDLTGIDLRGRNLSGASLIRATLRSARLDGCDLSNANLSAADLTGASLTASVLSDAMLCDAVLVGACLKNAQLSYADFTRADLRGADFEEASAEETDFQDVRIDVGQFDLLYFDPAGLNCPICGVWYDSESLDALGLQLDAECDHIDWKVVQPFRTDDSTGELQQVWLNDTSALRALPLEYVDDLESLTAAEYLDDLRGAIAAQLLDSYYEEFTIKSWWMEDRLGESRMTLYAFAADPQVALQAAWSSVRMVIEQLRNPFRHGTRGWSEFQQSRREYSVNIEHCGPIATE
jgi:uncharacterized protein YjbI with pentapeptide repeats